MQPAERSTRSANNLDICLNLSVRDDRGGCRGHLLDPATTQLEETRHQFLSIHCKAKGIAAAGLLFEIDCGASNCCTSVRADACTATNSAFVTQWSEASDRYHWQRPLQ